MEEKRITFDDIQKANKTIKTTDVKGKDYAEVNQRIKAFRMLYPSGTILTEMVSNENGVCIFKASVYDGDDHILATGTAYEKEGSTFINKTSYIENCETSAVGRALGMCGFGIDTSIASAEEVQNAIANQENKSTSKTVKTASDIKIQPTQIEIITKYYVGENMDKLLKANNLSKLEDMSMVKASEIIKKLQEVAKRKAMKNNERISEDRE